MNIDITINNTLQTFQVDENYMLDWTIYQSQPTTLQLPTTVFQTSPLWLLLNETVLINANITSVLVAQNSRVITVQHALEIEYFYLLYTYLENQGILLFMESVPLLLFSLHIWLQSPDLDIVDTLILQLMKHYPQYITQPNSIKKAHNKARKNITDLQSKLNQYLAQIKGTVA